MNRELKRDLLKSLLRFKKTGHSFSDYLVNEMHSDLNIAEIFVLTCVKERCGKDCPGENPPGERGGNASARDAMRSTLFVSKAAVSQTLGSLEKKGCVERAIDRDNRRRIVITLTDAGRAALENSTAALDKLAADLISRFGEAKTGELIRLVNSFAALVEELGEAPGPSF
jgi:DNA-binding MarR family transcriptional regulator